jgi:hypothetical protein
MTRFISATQKDDTKKINRTFIVNVAEQKLFSQLICESVMTLFVHSHKWFCLQY